MKTKKRRWVAVNYDTGEIKQTIKATTKPKALKMFGDLKGFEVLENMSQLQNRKG